jgi:hypothetical protein
MILTVPIDKAGEFYPTLGEQVCEFIEQNLVFGPGDLRGQPAVLDDEKRALVYKIYEVYPKGHLQAGRRRFKRAALSLRKGTAKTEFAAWIAACELHPEAPVRCKGFTKKGAPIGGPVSDPYIPLVAYTEEQSEDLAYGALRVILELSTLKDDFIIGFERIERKKGDGKAVALATAPDARDGARTTFQHFDEPLALDTLVPTLAGWRTIGDINPGEFVYSRTGEPIKVVGASDVKVGRPCFRVVFDNGESVITDESHRWTAIDWRNRPGGERHVTTREMFDAGLETSHGKRWRLPRAHGFDGVHADVPVDPYLLGLWLGDGAAEAGYIHNAPGDYAEVSQLFLHTVSQDSRPGVVRWLPTGLRSRLRKAGLLGHKHIPGTYLFASRAQRKALLQGLMDTDGYTSPGGTCTFVQKHRALCEEVAVLIRSLGVNATVTETPDERSRTSVMCKVHFSPDFAPFRLGRKADAAIWCPRVSTSWPTVVAIEPVHSVPVRCIAVDSDDHLFLVGPGLHLTHNTHRFTLPRLVRAHQTMLANIPKRKLADAWSLETTTAPEPGSGSVAEATMEYARAVETGTAADARLFFFHREASDQHDLTTDEGVIAAVREASGPTADWSDLDSIAEQWRDPTADRAYLERVWLNRLVQSSTQAFDAEQFKALARAATPVNTSALITIGFDGAMFFDSTALVATDVETGYQWVAGLWERPAKAETWQVPAAEVDAVVRDLFHRYTVCRFYADPFKWQSWLATWSGELDADRGPQDKRVIEWRTNRLGPMAAAVENYDTAIKEGTLSHDGDARLVRHIANARKHHLTLRDGEGQLMWVIRKDRHDSPRKIDAAMAAILSWEARTDAIAAGALHQEAPSVYLTRGVRSLADYL